MQININFREVPPKRLWLQGSGFWTHRFEISVRPVSIAEFRKFCKSTNYITTAEDVEQGSSYLSSPSLDPSVQDSPENTPVTYVSHVDAQAFCAWADVCLPTDLEWLLASVRCWEPIMSEDCYWTKVANLDPGELEWHVFAGGPEWIESDVNGQAIVRVAPRIFRKEDAAEDSYPLPSLSYSDAISFRVVNRRFRKR